MPKRPSAPKPTQPSLWEPPPLLPSTPQPQAPGDIERLLRWPASRPLLIGTDEAGRGPLAGPVVAAAVCLDPKCLPLPALDDSKRLSESQRDALFEPILASSLAAAVTSVDAPTIDEVNILQASLAAMFQAVRLVLSILDPATKPLVLVDGKVALLGPWSSLPIVSGDHLSWHIAAASILAKVCRDQLMVSADARFPRYGFAGHKGYPTAAHRSALAAFGPSSFHRRSFRGVKEHIDGEPAPKKKLPLSDIAFEVLSVHPQPDKNKNI